MVLGISFQLALLGDYRNRFREVPHAKKLFLAIAIAAAVVFVRLAMPDPLHANGSPAAALTGQVSSQKEGLMEGVVVGAKKEDSTITVNVMSDEKGRYSFPASKLGPGRYALKIRAAGYDLDGPKEVNVVAEKPTTANLKLKPTRKSRRSVDQRGMGFKHSRHGGAEEISAGLQQLPHVGARHAVQSHRG